MESYKQTRNAINLLPTRPREENYYTSESNKLVNIGKSNRVTDHISRRITGTSDNNEALT